MDLSISEKFHFQPEVLYTMEGNGEDEFDVNFIRIPLMAKYYVADAFSIHAGPQVGFVAGGGEAKEYMKSFDFGVGLGMLGAGKLAELTSLSTTFTISAVICIFSLIFLVFPTAFRTAVLPGSVFRILV